MKIRREIYYFLVILAFLICAAVVFYYRGGVLDFIFYAADKFGFYKNEQKEELLGEIKLLEEDLAKNKIFCSKTTDLKNLTAEDLKAEAAPSDFEMLIRNEIKNYFVCRSVQSADAGACGILENSLPRGARYFAASYLNCYNEAILPVLVLRGCAAEAINRCADKDACAAFCGVAFKNEEKLCQSVKSDAVRYFSCFALARDNASACDEAAEKDRAACHDYYYYFKALKEKSLPLAGKIKNEFLSFNALAGVGGSVKCEAKYGESIKNLCAAKITEQEDKLEILKQRNETLPAR